MPLEKSNKAKRKVMDYAYVKKETMFDRNRLVTQDKYTLLSIARNDIFISEVYLNYFPSIFSKEYSEKRQKNMSITKIVREYFSQFFMTFLEIIILKSLFGRKKGISENSSGMINEIFDQKLQSQQQQLLSSFLKNQIAMRFDLLLLQLNEDRQAEKYLYLAEKVQQKIQKTLKALYEKLNLNTLNREQLKKSVQKLRLKQQLPDKLDDQQVVNYIKYNFECICNIQSFRKPYKRQNWVEFYNLHKNYIPMSIEFIMDSKMNPKYNQIILPPVTEEVSPIIMTLEAYLNQYSELGETGEQEVKRKNCLVSLSRTLIQFCYKYNKATKNYYPNLSIGDVFFDQKRLSIALSYQSLLMDAVGLKENTKNYELRLATEATPKGPDYAKTYLQIKEKHSLNKRYTPMRNEDKDEEYMQAVKAKPRNKKEAICEQIHVERLIRLIYFIQRQANFTNDYYNGKFNKQNKAKIPRPFYKSEYEKVLKQISEKVEGNSLNIEQIINFPEQKEGFSQNKFQQEGKKEPVLSFAYFTDKFGFGNEDSLLDSLKYQYLRSHLYELHLIYQEINYLILGKQSFKSLPNSKKYILVFYISKYYQLESFRVKNAKQKELVKNQPCMIKRNAILQESKQALEKEFAGVKMANQMKKVSKIKKDASDKLIEYETRKESVSKYIEKNKKYFQPIKADVLQGQLSVEFFRKLQNIIERCKDIIFLISEHEESEKKIARKVSILLQNLQKIEIYFLDECFKDKRSEAIKSYFQWLGQRIQKLIKEKNTLAIICEVVRKIEQYYSVRLQLEIKLALAEIKKLTLQFIANEIEQQIKKTPQKFHNNQSSSQNWGKTCQFYNNKFFILIKIFFFINQQTLQRYQSNYKKLILGKEELPKLQQRKLRMISFVENKIQRRYKENLELEFQSIKTIRQQNQRNEKQFLEFLNKNQQVRQQRRQQKQKQQIWDNEMWTSQYELQQNILKQTNN